MIDDATDLPTTPRRNWLRIAVLVVLLAAAFGLYLRYQSSLRTLSAQSANVEVFDARLQNLEKSIVLYEKRISDLEAGHPAAATPEANNPSPAVDGDRIAALEKQIATLKSTQPLDETRISTSIILLSSYHRLRDRLVTGKPYASELANFQEAFGADEAAQPLFESIAPFAESGIPTAQALSGSFDSALDALSIAEAVPPADATLWQRFLYNLRRIISIRRTAEIQGNSTDAILARAQADLDREEIEAAVAEIKTLPDMPRAAFAGWLEEAQLVLSVPALLDQLEEQVMRKAFGMQPKAADKGQQ